MALGGGLVTEPRHPVVLRLVGRWLEVDLLAGQLLLSHHHTAQGEVRAGGGGEAGAGNSWGETTGPDGLVSPASDEDLNITW